MVQAYLPAVRDGDKGYFGEWRTGGRGQPYSNDREARSNFHVGGTAVAAQLTVRDKHICAAIGLELKRRGLLFVGIDIIGDYLTEINVTSTGIREVQRFSDIDIAALTIDAIEQQHPLHVSNSIAC